jgi:hypothetical protein
VINRSGFFETWVHSKEQSRPDAGREIGVLERRGKPRVSEPFPTTVSGIDKAGEFFRLDCVLDNISSTGAYLKMPRQLEQGSELRLIVNFSAGPSPGAAVAIRGVALRSDPQADKRWGLAVTITDYTLGLGSMSTDPENQADVEVGSVSYAVG